MQRSINIDNVSQMDKYGNQTTLPHIVISSRCGCSIPQLNEYKSDAHPSTTQSHRTVSLAGWLNASNVIQAMCKNQPQHQQQINQCPTDCSSPDVYPVHSVDTPSVNHFNRKSKTTKGISCIYYKLRTVGTDPQRDPLALLSSLDCETEFKCRSNTHTHPGTVYIVKLYMEVPYHPQGLRSSSICGGCLY